jgi:hypothetical protein
LAWVQLSLSDARKDFRTEAFIEMRIILQLFEADHLDGIATRQSCGAVNDCFVKLTVVGRPLSHCDGLTCPDFFNFSRFSFPIKFLIGLSSESIQNLKSNSLFANLIRFMILSQRQIFRTTKSAQFTQRHTLVDSDPESMVFGDPFRS